MELEPAISPLEFIEASIRKNQNQLVLVEVDIKFLNIKRRRLLLTQNPLEEQTVTQQIRDKEQAKASLEENLRILAELKEESKPKLLT